GTRITMVRRQMGVRGQLVEILIARCSALGLGASTPGTAVPRGATGTGRRTAGGTTDFACAVLPPGLFSPFLFSPFPLFPLFFTLRAKRALKIFFSKMGFLAVLGGKKGHFRGDLW
ncbi:hypothetical protein, partial [Phormidium sp. CCY1219]|uniref:hypothetical protein n=1 Tax=Phormidium sp. CCY1219 TaxID=2886104 RepID=UPI002D1F3E63